MLMKISRSGAICFPQEVLDKYNLKTGDGICFESLGSDMFSIKKVERKIRIDGIGVEGVNE